MFHHMLLLALVDITLLLWTLHFTPIFNCVWKEMFPSANNALSLLWLALLEMLLQNISSSFHSLYTPIMQNETALVFQASHAFSEKQNVTEVLTMSESSTSQQMKGSVSGKAENASPDETFLDDAFPENAQRYPSQKRVDRPMSAKPTRPIRSLEGADFHAVELPFNTFALESRTVLLVRLSRSRCSNAAFYRAVPQELEEKRIENTMLYALSYLRI